MMVCRALHQRARWGPSTRLGSSSFSYPNLLYTQDKPWGFVLAILEPFFFTGRWQPEPLPSACTCNVNTLYV